MVDSTKHFSECKIDRVSEFKYLGVIIDEQLRFDSFAVFVAKKVAKKANFMYRVNKCVSPITMVIIYKTIVATHFEYCSTLILNFDQYSLGIFQKAQNRTIRAILKYDR